MSQESVLHKIVRNLPIGPAQKDELELEVSAEFGVPDEVAEEGE